MKPDTILVFVARLSVTALVPVLVAACGGGGGADGSGKRGMPSSITSQAKVEPGSQCPNGGVEIFYGIDENGNGELDESEIDGSEIICHGPDGAPAEQNAAPIADAGSYQTVSLGAVVELNGENSFDPEGELISFDWLTLQIPPGSSAVLADPTSAITTFEADAIGYYQFQLLVRDEFSVGFSPSVQVSVEAPAIGFTTPLWGESGVSIQSNVTLYFNVPMDTVSVEAAFTLYDEVINAVAGSVAWSDGDRTLTFDPAEDLLEGAGYIAVVWGGGTAFDKLGNGLDQQFDFSFTTESESDDTPPQVLGSYPSAGSTNVPLNSTVTIVFSERMDTASVFNAFSVDRLDEPVGGEITWNGDETELTFTHGSVENPMLLESSATYTVTITTGAIDLGANALDGDGAGGDFVLEFTTEAVIQPTVTAFSPSLDEIITIDTPSIVVTFSEAMDTTLQNLIDLSCTVSLDHGTLGGSWSGDTVLTAGGVTLLNGDVCTITVSGAARNVLGVMMGPSASSTFSVNLD